MMLMGVAALLGAACLPPSAPRPLYAAAPGAPRVVIRGAVLELNQAIYFETNSDKLLALSYPILDEVARVLREHPDLQRVRIEGHTDNVGTPTYNLMLSQRRAQSVAAYLQRRGVGGQRLLAAGFGQSQPVAENNNEEGRARNRRVAFVIVSSVADRASRSGAAVVDREPPPGGPRSASLGRGVQ